MAAGAIAEQDERLEMTDELPRIVFLFAYALLFAAVEIEIEGAHGWAERLPTWYRVRPRYARLFGALMGGKPLTGYHAVMILVPLVSLHAGFVHGLRWSWAGEAAVLAAYLVWVPTWDFLWFLLNPSYGWRRFRKGEIWWLDGQWLGRLPADYLRAFVASAAVAASPFVVGDGLGVLWRHLILTAGLCALTLAIVPLVPLYQRWYRHMRREGADERSLAGRPPSRPED
jgi:hypothetical protein